MKLYELSEQYHRAVTELSEGLLSGELDEQTVADTLEGLKGEVTDKAINVALHIKNLRSDADQYRGAKQEFEQKLRRTERELDFFERYLEHHMRVAGIDEAGNQYCTVKFRKLPAIVECNWAPPEFSIIVPEQHKPDKKKIKDAILAGVDLSTFATLVTDRVGLSIK